MHQANLRINEAVQKRLGLPDEKVFNNIQRYGNTTAATIPIAFHEARRAGRVEAGRPGLLRRPRQRPQLGRGSLPRVRPNRGGAARAVPATRPAGSSMRPTS